MYCGRRPVHCLKEALQSLGVTRLRDIVWQVVTGMRMLRGGALTSVTEQLQGHNLFVAHASRLVADRANVVAEEAFLGGLLHDVGVSAVLSALVDTGEPLPPLGTLVEAMDSVHEQAGGLIAALWQPSPDLSLVIKMRHRDNPHAKRVPLLAGVICVAERLAQEVGRVVIKNPSSEAERTFDQQKAATFEQALKRLELNGKYPQLLSEAKELNAQLATSQCQAP
jgi:HD-like signal output (HDOD) protein